MAEATTNRRSIEVLATHDAETTYTGIQERRCMFMTSLCPDHCNHANKWALFRVDKYLGYEKPGQYGDEEQKQFALQLRPVEERVEHAPGTHALVAALAVGDRVHIRWLHEYVTDEQLDAAGAVKGSAKYPIRRVVAIERL